jgi:hypothetical protein
VHSRGGFADHVGRLLDAYHIDAVHIVALGVLQTFSCPDLDLLLPPRASGLTGRIGWLGSAEEGKTCVWGCGLP